MILCPELLRDYPEVEGLMGEEDPTISTLHYIGGSHLFLLMGTSTGTIWAVPMSIKSHEDLVVVKDSGRQEIGRAHV